MTSSSNNPLDKIIDKKHAELSVDPLDIQSFVDLVDRNRQVHDRARQLVELGNNEKVSPPIVLKDSTFEDGQGMAIGFVVLDTFAWNATKAQRLSVKVYNINSNQLDDIKSRFEDIEKILVTTDNNTEQAMQRLMGRAADGLISRDGLAISTEAKELDEINVTARLAALKGFFLSRIMRLRRRKNDITQSIDEMDVTIDRFEWAASNPDLNPDYASIPDDDLEQIWNLPAFKR